MTSAGGASLDPANDEAQEVELGNVRLIHARDYADGNGYSDRPFHEVLQPTGTSRCVRRGQWPCRPRGLGGSQALRARLAAVNGLVHA